MLYHVSHYQAVTWFTSPSCNMFHITKLEMQSRVSVFMSLLGRNKNSVLSQPSYEVNKNLMFL